MTKHNLATKYKLLTPDKLRTWLAAIFAFSVALIIAVFVFYFINFDGGLSDRQDQWGAFGDFIGGTLNPILSFFALIALLLTIVLQSNELEATREELKRSANAQEISAENQQRNIIHIESEAKKNELYRVIRLIDDNLDRLGHTDVTFKFPDGGSPNAISISFYETLFSILVDYPKEIFPGNNDIQEYIKIHDKLNTAKDLRIALETYTKFFIELKLLGSYLEEYINISPNKVMSLYYKNKYKLPVNRFIDAGYDLNDFWIKDSNIKT